jgi:sialate O-acetylesterase
MNSFLPRGYVYCLLTLLAQMALADVRLPALLSDHMVLQQNEKAALWGWADPGETVTATIAGKKESTRAGSDGKWRIKFPRLKAGGPYTLTISGKNTVTVNDVLVGEVWLGSGQSNMAFAISRGKDFETERAASDLPQIRMFKVDSGGANEPQEDCKGTWLVCSPETVGGFSGVLYFFGRELHRELKVPMGLIHSSVGGTPIESWTSAEAQEKSPDLRPFLDKLGLARTNVQGARGPRVGGLFNGKIAPLTSYRIRGAIWYQGEANANSESGAHFYQFQLPLLIKDWRSRWASDIPFAWVQLPNFSGRSNGWCLVREGMLKTLELPHTGMAVTLDVGEDHNLHPRDKQSVGHRLAQWALGDVYGKPVPATSGPLAVGHKVRGKEFVVQFKHTEGGLVAHGGELRGFELAGADKLWKPANARVDGSRIAVSCSEISEPIALRYAWRDAPDCNLYNGAGLPASPFRTDDW